MSTANVICPTPPQTRRKAESFHTCVLFREVSFPYLCIQPVQYINPSIHISRIHPVYFLCLLSSASSSQLHCFLQWKTCDMSKRYYLRALMGHELPVTNQGQDLRIAINSSMEKNALDALPGPKHPTLNQVSATIWKERRVKKTITT